MPLPASRLAAGRVTHAMPSVKPVPHTVAPAPAPAQQAAAVSKMQPQLQHLPRFQPPSFEGANGLLPCPDSPGSTPRGDEDESREDEPQLTAVAIDKRHMEQSLEVIEQDKENEKDNSTPFPVGSYVEYKSRSS